jgi:hypothetical protein
MSLNNRFDEKIILEKWFQQKLELEKWSFDTDIYTDIDSFTDYIVARIPFVIRDHDVISEIYTLYKQIFGR